MPSRRAGSAGPDAVRIATEEWGYELDDWQIWCIDCLLSEDEQMRLCGQVGVLLVSRQNGKNVILEIVELFCFYVLDWQVIYHTAHLQSTSNDHQQRMQAMIEANEDLSSITKFYTANGQARIERLDTKAQIRFVTRSDKIGRGPSPRLVVFDEALHLTDQQVNAIMPGMSAQSMKRDKPLMIYTSSAPLLSSITLHRVRNALLDGSLDGFLADWGIEAPKDSEERPLRVQLEELRRDRQAWADSNPGLNIRISEEWIEQMEIPVMTLEGFAQERLGIVFEPDSTPSELPTWGSCVDENGQIVSVTALVVDISLDLSTTSIGVAGFREDGLCQIEIIDLLTGTAGAVARLKELSEKYELPVYLLARSESAGLIADLAKAEVQFNEVGALDYMRACVTFRQLVTNRELRHIGQEQLNRAVIGASVAVAGAGWVWQPRTSSADISPLIALTIAAWVAVQPDAESVLIATF